MKGKVTKTGYKKNSPDVNNDYNIIPSGRITMKGVQFPVYGVDEYGNAQMMYPGGEYQFPGSTVFELPMYQTQGETRDVYLDDVDAQHKMNFLDRVKRFGWRVNDRIQQRKNFNKSKDFLEGWHTSPMYQEMRQAEMQDPLELNETDWITDNRLENLKRINRFKINYGAPEEGNERTAAYYSPLEDNLLLVNRQNTPSHYGSKDLSGLFTHELTHAADHVHDGKYYLPAASQINILNNAKDWHEDMREFEEELGISSSEEQKEMDDLKSFGKYVQDPTEVRARLNVVRQAAKEAGVYDPFTEKLNEESFQKLEELFSPDSDYIPFGADQFDQLRTFIYPTGEDLMEALNTISARSSGQDIPMAQLGGMRRGKVDRILNENRDLNFVQRMYQPGTPSIMIPGQDGPSTHFMESADGFVYPTVVQMPDGNLQYLGEGAYDHAMQTGEYIQFPNDRQARRFAKSYKKGTGVLEEYGKGGLTQWFDEKWVDVKTGKECGRSGKDKNGRPYPACRPSKRVNETTPKTTSEMSSSEKAKFKREKTSGKRINYNHKRAQEGGQPVSLSWNDPEYRDYYNRLDKDVVIADPSGKTAGWEFLDEIEVYPDKRNLQPYWDTLTEEEKRFWNDDGPIGRHVRMKAREGHGLTADDATNFVKALTLGPLDDALEIASIPSAAAAETFARVKGDPYDYSNVLPSFGTWNNTQRSLSETAADEVKWISKKTGIPEWAVGFGFDFASDPTLWVPATAAAKAPMQAIKAGTRIAKTGARRGIRTGVNRITNAVDNIPSRINPKYYNPTSVSTGNPDVYYRKVGKDAYEDFVNSGVLRTQAEVTDNPIMGLIETKRELGQVRDAIKDYGQFTYRHPTSFRAPYFSRGRTADMTSGADDYLFQTRPGVVGDDAFSSGQMDILHGSGNARVPVGGYGIMDPMQRSAENFDVFKKSWWHGYKPVNNLQKGGQKPEPTDWVDYLNPMNWFVTNRDQDGDFKQAFRAARNAGDDEFMWYGTRYTTDYAPQSDIKTVPVKKKEVAPAEIDLDFDTLKRGVSFVESRNGKYMWNPESSATGLYGQRFSEIQDTDVYSGTRENFRDDLDAQNRIFELRFNGELPGSTTGLKKDALDLYKEYYPIVKKNNISPVEIAALSNFLGRQGTRYYLGYVLRDGRSLEDVFPNLYGPEAGQSNKTPDQYLELFREAAYAEEQKVGGEIEKHPDYSDHSSYVNAWKAARRQLGAGKKFKYGGRVMSTSTPNGH